MIKVLYIVMLLYAIVSIFIYGAMDHDRENLLFLVIWAPMVFLLVILSPLLLIYWLGTKYGEWYRNKRGYLD